MSSLIDVLTNRSMPLCAFRQTLDFLDKVVVEPACYEGRRASIKLGETWVGF